MLLHEVLAQQVENWQQQGFPHVDHPAIAEILDYASGPEPGVAPYLRQPQLRALITYWYLRLVEETPRTFDLYQRLFQRNADRLDALGIPTTAFVKADYDLDTLWDMVREDDSFVREFKLETLRETLSLDYPSYILALAMGAGKTVLIGAIIATEFAMALEYPDGPFVQNALVFAPGKTILESLRELADVPYERILPPRLYKPFVTTIKLTFTRDGEKDIPVIRGSSFNLVVTNTEKIRIQKEAVRKADLGGFFASGKEDEAKAEVANLRLQTIASLPHLAICSDEAHHTYGQALDTELKKVRKTVDYLASNTNVVCVVNTTGTPYFQKQPLKDVVVWYGLSTGIRDGILKEVAGSIHAFSFDGNVEAYITHVIEDFFKDYGVVTLPNGAPAKLAMYFPQMNDLEELRPAVDAKLAQLGYPPTVCLRNTSESSQAEVDAFNRLNEPDSPHRVILLVNKGTEGWNCPSLFACALARKLRSSNNFVLQAATRCLRQVPGNRHKARIYLSMDNRAILDRQLQETYNETLSDMNQASSVSRKAVIRLRKVDLPPLVVKRVVRTVVPGPAHANGLFFTRPTDEASRTLEMVTLDIASHAATRNLLRQVGDAITITALPDTVSLYGAAVSLAADYRVDVWKVYDELRRVYPGEAELPVTHLALIGKQLEEQTRNYEVREEVIERALALVKLDGFNREVSTDGAEVYTAEIGYPASREHLIAHLEQFKGTAGEFGFHYTPYNFDSRPELDFFDQLLGHLKVYPQHVEDIYFTGALTDAKKSDFAVEYRSPDGKWHRYTPDFVIRRKDGKCLIVEIKDARFEPAVQADLDSCQQGQPAVHVEGMKAVALQQWVDLDPDRLKYQIIFAASDAVPYEETIKARRFVERE